MRAVTFRSGQVPGRTGRSMSRGRAMRGIIRSAAMAGWLAAAGLLAAGCSVGAPAPYQATVDTCYAFGVQALDRHITVTAVPRACTGLSRAQVNLAVARAIRDVAGP